MSQPSLFDAPADPTHRTDGAETSRVAAKTLDPNPREQECIEALRLLVCASDTHDIQRALAEYGLLRDRNCIARRLTSLERRGIVRRAGVKQGAAGKPTTLWALVA